MVAEKLLHVLHSRVHHEALIAVEEQRLEVQIGELEKKAATASQHWTVASLFISSADLGYQIQRQLGETKAQQQAVQSTRGALEQIIESTKLRLEVLACQGEASVAATVKRQMRDTEELKESQTRGLAPMQTQTSADNMAKKMNTTVQLLPPAAATQTPPSKLRHTPTRMVPYAQLLGF